MRKDFGKQTWLLPMPVLMIATYNEDGTANLMNAAWGGIYDTGKIGICLSAEHKTVKNILRTNEFTVSFANSSVVAACDYVGIVSGNDVPDKLAKAGLHAESGSKVNAPVIKELPLALECKLISYDETSGYMVGDIVNAVADESILDLDGKVDPARLNPILFDSIHHGYYTFGEKVGQAFSDGLTLK